MRRDINKCIWTKKSRKLIENIKDTYRLVIEYDRLRDFQTQLHTVMNPVY